MALEHYSQVVMSMVNSSLLPDNESTTHAEVWNDASYNGQSAWKDSRVIASYAAMASFAMAVLQAILITPPVERLRAQYLGRSPPVTVHTFNEPRNIRQRFYAHVSTHGGGLIFAYHVARLDFALVGFGLAIASLFLKQEFTWPDLALTFTVGYATVMASLNVVLPGSLARKASPHATAALLAVFFSFSYRNIWPLATFNLTPKDPSTAGLWLQVACSGVGGILLPLFEPYVYVPVDPLCPQAQVNPEQTASIASFLFYSFLDDVIYKASKVPHLKASEFPPMCDYDCVDNLVERAYPHLDPFAGAPKNRSLFWGIVRIFRSSLLWQSLVLVINACAKLASPIGTNRLIHYLETSGVDASVEPWFWILALIIGPIAETLCFQLYVFLSTGSLVRLEAIITSLVFDHALRIRLKAEVQDNRASPSVVPLVDAGTAILATQNPDAILTAAEGGDSEATMQAVPAPVNATSTTNNDDSASSSTGQNNGEVEEAKKEEGHTDKRSNNLIGRLNNLVTSDLRNITSGRDFLFVGLNAPVNFALGMAFLYAILGWSSFVGMGVMIALIPVPAWVATLLQSLQEVKMQATDARVASITETMSVLRMIKLFGWESRIENLISEKRQRELQIVWKQKLIELVNSSMNYVIPLVHMVVTYGVFTLVQRQKLTASTVFSSMAAFNMLRQQIFMITYFIPGLIQANVSVKRLQEFLVETELLDEFTSVEEEVIDARAVHQDEIGMSAASFAWSANESNTTATMSPDSLAPGRGRFRLQIEDEVIFRRGEINLVIGPTGSGKTSLLMALLGEMHYLPHGPESWINLPREGGVAYTSQESWIQNETIRDNILFGNEYDDQRYEQVIHQCGLKHDLSMFDAGDKTEVGEKGLTLSGGQKARITLARAVYSPAGILLLDDVFAALDVHTSKWIIEKCLKGSLIRGRTVILVTHNIALAAPVSSFAVVLGPEGSIISQGSVSDAITRDSRLAEIMELEAEKIAANTEQAKPGEEGSQEHERGQKGRLVVEEEIAEGHVSWGAFKLFVGSAGGSWPILYWTFYLAILTIALSLDAGETWWLGQWARQYTLYDRHPERVDAVYYLSVYGAIVGVVLVLYISSEATYVYGTLHAARGIHARLVNALLSSTFRWLDKTPTSRVIARCTEDIQAVDTSIANELGGMIYVTIMMFIQLGAVIFFTPIFILPGILLAIVGGFLGQIYMRAQLSVKREMSNAKAPVIGIFNGAMSGLVSIRAYGVQDMFRKESRMRIGCYVRSARTFYNLNRWITLRIEALSSLFAASLAAYLLYGPTQVDPSNVGFSLNMAVGFSSMILAWVRMFNDLEVEGNSLERITQYLNNDKEPKPTEGGIPPAYWPSSGNLRVEKLSARYSEDGPEVLRDVSFEVNSGERIGVVGRTGSGKSSLTLSLLRCIPTEGSVYLDGLPISALNLDSVRKAVTIIPQAPELMGGTLRYNLDMFNQHDDAVLNDALRSARFFSLQSDANANKITLESSIASGGSNLSVGQRQIIALARAMIRSSKLLILDEATSAVDCDTETVIQESLRDKLPKDVTIITIAHRLQTIMDSDKIMVLDAGRLVEFASPKDLLNRSNGIFKALVDHSADKDALRAMVKGTGT